MTIDQLKGIFMGIASLVLFILILIGIPNKLRKKPLYYICFEYNVYIIPFCFSCAIFSMDFMGLEIPSHINFIAAMLFIITVSCFSFLERLLIYSELQRKISKGEISVKSDIDQYGFLHYKSKIMMGISVVMYIAYGYFIMEIIKLN